MPAKSAFQATVAPTPAPGAVSAPKPMLVGVPPIVLPDAETLCFDAAPVFSHSNGQVAVTLTSRRYLPDGRGGVIEQEVVVGFLRCGLAAANSLRAAIDAATLLGRQAEGAGRN